MGKLVWLASYPKSGNTWLRSFIHNYVYAPDAPYDINRLSDFTTGESGASLYHRHDPRPASQYSLEDVARMRPLVHRDLTEAFPELVLVKTHNALLVDHEVPLVTPEVTAGAIYIVRDPRDVAISYSHHLGLPLDEVIELMANPETIAPGNDMKVYERISSWSVHVHFWTRRQNSRLHVMRYEDMQRNPEKAFDDVLRFLGVEPEPARFARALRFSSFDRSQKQEREHGFKEKPEAAASFFRSGRSGDWQNILTADQIDQIERDHGLEMQRFGYLLPAGPES